jgi:hypothetical protein
MYAAMGSGTRRSHKQTASHRPIKGGTLAGRVWHAVASLKCIHVVAPHERGIPERQRIEARIFAAASVAAIRDAAHGKCVEGDRHEIAAVVAKNTREVDRAEGRCRFDSITLALHRARSPRSWRCRPRRRLPMCPASVAFATTSHSCRSRRCRRCTANTQWSARLDRTRSGSRLHSVQGVVRG